LAIKQHFLPDSGATKRVALASGRILLVLIAAAAIASGGQGAEPRPTRTATVDISNAQVHELQAAMAQGDVSAAELVDLYLARIAAYDHAGPRLNAVLWLNPAARADAQRMDEERRRRGPRGPLHGIPVILKDNYAVLGMPTSAGSVVLAAAPTLREGHQVRRLRAAGAVILGKGNLHELASDLLSVSAMGGATRSPYDPARNPGGSSGGTAVAVAAGLSAIGMGTDTCGSLRTPAAFNSLVALRPTKGLSGISGIVPVAHSADTAAPITRTVEDLAVTLDATVGYDAGDPATVRVRGRKTTGFASALKAASLNGRRFGTLKQLYDPAAGADPEIVKVTEIAIADLKRAGAEVVEVRITDFDALVRGSHTTRYEFRRDFLDYLKIYSELNQFLLTQALERGAYHELAIEGWTLLNAKPPPLDGKYQAVLRGRSAFRDVVTRLMDEQQLDALVYPTMSVKPAPVGQGQTGSNCALSARTGLPALTVPAGFTDDLLPVGLELLGRAYDDRRLVSWGYAFEQATRRRRPPAITPALVDGVPPPPVAMRARASLGEGTGEVTGVFVLDPVGNNLSYEFSFTGIDPQKIYAVTLHASRSDGIAPVVAHLGRPDGARLPSGSLQLAPRDRAALDAGGVRFALYSRDAPTGAFSTPLTPGR
jgi:amidase